MAATKKHKISASEKTSYRAEAKRDNAADEYATKKHKMSKK